MLRNARASLQDIVEATDYLLDEAPVTDFAAYLKDKTLRFAVERAFMSIGEAMAVLRRDHPVVFDRFAQSNEMVGFRNILVHKYWSVDDADVWSTLQSKVEPLRELAKKLLVDSAVR